MKAICVILEALVVQRGGGCPDPGDFQGQAGAGPGQTDLDVDIPVHCREAGPDDL